MLIPNEITLHEIALWLGVTVSELESCASDSSICYKAPVKKRVKSRWREIEEPHPIWKQRFRCLYEELRPIFGTHSCVHGGARGRSCFTAANCHLGKRAVIQRDIRDCYPSITQAMLRDALLDFGASSDVADVLSKLLTVNNHVPHGSPLSGFALNVCLSKFDQRLASFCGRIGAKYTRTYDDIVISSDNASVVRRIEHEVDMEIERVGLKVNESKRKKKGLRWSHSIQRVHGLVVNSRRGVRVPDEDCKRLRELALSYVQSCLSSQPGELGNLLKKRRSLVGSISHYGQAANGPAPFMRRQLNAGDRALSRRLAHMGKIFPNQRWYKHAISIDESATPRIGIDDLRLDDSKTPFAAAT